jgi:hypothetical protein
MIVEHAPVVLTQDIPASRLKSGDVGTVVHVYPNGQAYEVEFMSLDGGTFAIQTLEPDQIRAAHDHDVPHVRELLAA